MSTERQDNPERAPLLRSSSIQSRSSKAESFAQPTVIWRVAPAMFVYALANTITTTTLLGELEVAKNMPIWILTVVYGQIYLEDYLAAFGILSTIQRRFLPMVVFQTHFVEPVNETPQKHILPTP